MSNIQSTFLFSLPTRIVFGPGCLKTLPEALKALKASHPLIVTDKGVAAAGILDKATAHLEGKLQFSVFDGVEANPKDVNVSEGAKAYSSSGADSIVALGGGSPMDCAKAIGVLAANGATDIKAYEGKNTHSNPLPPLVAVPTTAGTGSELTFSSVITDTKSKYKMTIKNAFTAAKTAVCDPELTLTVPAPTTAATGMDALTHAIEAFTAASAEPISDALALYAVELINGNLVKAVKDGANLEVRSKMLMGSLLAGIAFSHSDVASVHCVAEALGGMYDLPHGVCNAIFLPYVMEYNMNYCVEGYARIARAMGLSFPSERAGAVAAVMAVQELAKNVKLPSFASLNVKEEDFPAIAAAAAKNISTGSNPRPMSESDYVEVLKMALR
ncbi:MAG: iron-containing alcohol dehydrogenase [Treponema sp.]|nr:iron-containing alcohol dehydrogenase [Treponema sp.]